MAAADVGNGLAKRRDKRLVRLIIWGGGVALVFVIGMNQFPREYPHLGMLQSFYYTIRLFILENDISEFPQSWPLIFIYFFAPLLSLSALGTAIRYLFRMSPTLRTRWFSDHVIVCGVGRTGKLLAETFKSKGITVVGVDTGPAEAFEAWCSDHRIPIIHGDFLSRTVLERAGAAGARAIVYASGDDLLNLEGVISAYGWLKNDSGPVRLLWAHIAAEKLANTARIALRTEGRVGIRFFDTYRLAATKLIAKYFGEETCPNVTEVTILGFGKFGRDLMEVMVRECGDGPVPDIRVVDIQDRGKEVRDLAGDLNVSDKVGFFQADIADLTLSDDMDKAFFLCTDDDIGNLAVALMLTRKTRGSHIYVRMAKWPISAIADHLQENSGITFININDLVVAGVMDLPGIFEPAKETDLKRSGKDKRE